MIRAATIADLPRILELGALMHAESRYRVMSFSRDKLLRTMGGLIGAPNGFVWVVEEGGQVVGGLAAMCGAHWASDDLLATDLGLFFAPEYRGGVAVVRLVNRYKQWASTMGAKLTDLGVSTGIDADRTADLYDRIGFPRCGTIHSAE